MLCQTDVENLRVSGDLVYFNPPYGRGKVGKGERWQPFMTFLEKNRYKEVATSALLNWIRSFHSSWVHV